MGWQVWVEELEQRPEAPSAAKLHPTGLPLLGFPTITKGKTVESKKLPERPS